MTRNGPPGSKSRRSITPRRRNLCAPTSISSGSSRARALRCSPAKLTPKATSTSRLRVRAGRAELEVEPGERGRPRSPAGRSPRGAARRSGRGPRRRRAPPRGSRGAPRGGRRRSAGASGPSSEAMKRSRTLCARPPRVSASMRTIRSGSSSGPRRRTSLSRYWYGQFA